ncbi:MAG: hypothetical protein NVS9B10_04590 [Nevskia sp.]
MDAIQHRSDLAGWLSSLPPPSAEHLLLGGTGHLLLSPAEIRRASDYLEHEVLPSLLSDSGIRCVSLITGLAPGADLLFKQLTAAWLRRAGIEFEAIALMPVPMDMLIRDWVVKSHEESAPVDARELDGMRQRLEAMLADCDTIVDLLPRGTSPAQLAQPAFRQDQYRRLAACLAEQTDVLVALLREQNLGQPGGTAEVVDWRRDASRIPPSFSTLTLRAAPSSRQRLIIIDPSAGA